MTDKKPKKRTTPVLLAVSTTIALASCGSPSVPAVDTNSTEVASALPTDQFLPNMNSGEFTVALESLGFVVNKEFGQGYIMWTAKSFAPGIDYTVSYGSPKAGHVQDYSAQAMMNVMEKKPIASYPFLKEVATAPFRGEDASHVAEWLKVHYEQSGNHTDTVAGVEVRLMCPSDMVRMVSLRVVQ